MRYAVAVTLKIGAHGAVAYRVQSAFGIGGVKCLRTQIRALALESYVFHYFMSLRLNEDIAQYSQSAVSSMHTISPYAMLVPDVETIDN